MGGAVGGGLGGAALGTLIAPGVGTAVGATLGGLAGQGASNLLGGSSGGGTTNVQPQAGTSFQVYQPQNQPGLDQAYQNLLSPLYNQALGGVQSLGNISPVQQVYPQVSQIAQGQAVPGTLPGSYGPYGDVALGKNLWSLGTLQDIYGTPQNLINYGLQTGTAGLSDIPAVQAAAFNPQIGQAVQNVINNPFLQQQLQGAQTGAGIGGQAAGLTPQQTQLMNALGLTLPGLGSQAAATTGAQIPLVQALAAGSAARGMDLSGQAQAAAAPLGGTAQQLLQTGFDPQSALYNRTAQQIRDQQQAINAMSGVGTSPYGAGVTGQTMANFNIDWQNQQLQRQAQAAQAASGVINQQLAGLTGAGNIFAQGAQGAGTLAGQVGTLAGQGLQQQLNAAAGAGNLFAGGLNLGQGGSALAAQAGALPAAAYQQQQANALNALLQQNQLAGAGVTNLANLTSQLGAAGQQPLSAFQSINQLAAQPYATAQAQGQNAIQALMNQVNVGNQLYTLPQQVQNQIQSYLKLGQSASAYGGNLALANQQATASQLAGLGALGGGIGNLLGGGGGAFGGLSNLIGFNSPLTPAASGSDFFIPGTDTAITGASFPVGGSSGLLGLFGGGGG